MAEPAAAQTHRRSWDTHLLLKQFRCRSRRTCIQKCRYGLRETRVATMCCSVRRWGGVLAWGFTFNHFFDFHRFFKMIKLVRFNPPPRRFHQQRRIVVFIRKESVKRQPDVRTFLCDFGVTGLDDFMF